LRNKSQFFSSPLRCAGISAHVPSSRSPLSRTVSPPVLLLLDELVGAVIPDLDGAGAVVPRGNLALEGCVVERVVLHVHGERLLPGLERNALGNGPAGERTIPLEAEVVVEPARVMALHDEDRLLRLPSLPGEGFRSLLRISLAPVLGELLFCHQFLRFLRFDLCSDQRLVD
jgi:hypothetical protein